MKANPHPARIRALLRETSAAQSAASAQVKAGAPALEATVRSFRLAALLARAIGLESVPSRAVGQAVLAWTAKRAIKGGRFEPIQRPRSESGRLLKFWYDWHRGATGGSLWGPMMRVYEPDSMGFDSVVQVAQYVRTGRASPALERWRDALGYGGAR